MPLLALICFLTCLLLLLLAVLELPYSALHRDCKAIHDDVQELCGQGCTAADFMHFVCQ